MFIDPYSYHPWSKITLRKYNKHLFRLIQCASVPSVRCTHNVHINSFLVCGFLLYSMATSNQQVERRWYTQRVVHIFYICTNMYINKQGILPVMPLVHERCYALWWPLKISYFSYKWFPSVQCRVYQIHMYSVIDG